MILSAFNKFYNIIKLTLIKHFTFVQNGRYYLFLCKTRKTNTKYILSDLKIEHIRTYMNITYL